MRYLLLISVFFGLLIGCLGASAQEVLAEEAAEFDCYQVFLEQPLSSIDKITYRDDAGTDIIYQLIEDGETIILDNYLGKRSIKIEGKDAKGEKKEILRSPCRIDPCIPSL